MTDRLLSYLDLVDILGVSYITLRQWKSRGKLPEPDQVVDNKPMWTESTIREWDCDHTYQTEAVDGGGSVVACVNCGRIE